MAFPSVSDRGKPVFFFFVLFVSRRAYMAECTAKSPRHLATKNRDTALYDTTYTLQVNMPQDGCTSMPKVAGVMSPATP